MEDEEKLTEAPGLWLKAKRGHVLRRGTVPGKYAPAATTPRRAFRQHAQRRRPRNVCSQESSPPRSCPSLVLDGGPQKVAQGARG